MFERVADSLFGISDVLGVYFIFIVGVFLTLVGIVCLLMIIACLFSIVGYVLRMPRLRFDKEMAFGDTLFVLVVSLIIGMLSLQVGTSFLRLALLGI